MLRRNLLAAPLAALPLALPAWAHSDKSHGAAGGKPEPVATDVAPAGSRDAATYFTNLELLTQDGRTVRFYADMLEGKTVVMNVIYTNCKDACPLITQVLKEVRSRLSESASQIQFITLSSDPIRDTPQALKQFAQKQGVDVPGWTFLTGRKDNVDHILKKLGQYSPEVEGHSTLLIAGNVPAKRWSKIRPDAPPQAIVARLALLAGDGNVPLPGGAASAAVVRR